MEPKGRFRSNLIIAPGMRAAYWPRKDVFNVASNVVIVSVVVHAHRRVPSLTRFKGLVAEAKGTKPCTKKYAMADDATTEQREPLEVIEAMRPPRFGAIKPFDTLEAETICASSLLETAYEMQIVLRRLLHGRVPCQATWTMALIFLSTRIFEPEITISGCDESLDTVRKAWLRV
jgi:hypothetical protein